MQDVYVPDTYYWTLTPILGIAGVPDSSLTTPAGQAEVGSMESEGITVGKQGNPIKDAAREVLKQLNATEKQSASANRAITRATTSSKIAIKREMENIVVSVTRTGRNGYQVFENVIDQYGNKQVVQHAYDELGKLVHFDPK